MNNHEILLVTAPFCQPNTPYPATAFLKGYLKMKGFDVEQLDLSIEVLNKILTPDFLNPIIEKIPEEDTELYLIGQQYVKYVVPVKEFLQGKNDGFAYRINHGALPEGGRSNQIKENMEIYTEDTILDKAKYRATVFIEEIIDIIAKYEDTNFGFSRYAERISSFSASFDQVEEALDLTSAITQQFTSTLVEKIEENKPYMVGFSVPFPGNLISTLHCCKKLKEQFPEIKILIGGGFVNTELRSLNEPRLFNYVDYVTLDDGEKPLEQILRKEIRNEEVELVRTFTLDSDGVNYQDNTSKYPLSHQETGAPDYTGLPWELYMEMVEMTNPMHRLWTEGKWVKMMVAHGCYWHKCSFCDTSLDYIRRYSQASAKELCDRIEEVIKQTQIRSFHFIDEAAPPKILVELSVEILRRGLQITWWTNVRFEKAFTPSVSRLLAKAGCIGVSGGLEVASDRLLKMMNKGVTITQVARVTKAMREAGILVHAYLMYGFPTQTEQETVDALEVVRQLFENGCIDSGFWHRFAMTVHSPVGLDPESFGVERIDISDGKFAENDCDHLDPKGADHSLYGDGLKRSLYNYMHYVGLDFKLQQWFEHPIPKTHIAKDFISNALMESSIVEDHPRAKLWISPDFKLIKLSSKKKKSKIAFMTTHGLETINIDQNSLEMIEATLAYPEIRIQPILLSEISKWLESQWNKDLYSLFIHKAWMSLKSAGWEVI